MSTLAAVEIAALSPSFQGPKSTIKVMGSSAKYILLSADDADVVDGVVESGRRCWTRGAVVDDDVEADMRACATESVCKVTGGTKGSGGRCLCWYTRFCLCQR